jgi:hypothetical protein
MPGSSICPNSAVSFLDENYDRLQTLNLTISKLQALLMGFNAKFISNCNSRCGTTCPAQCSPTSGCTSGCPFELCIDCDRLSFTILQANASLQEAENTRIVLQQKFDRGDIAGNGLYDSKYSNSCVDSIAKCFSNTTLSNSTAFFNTIRSEAQFCSDIKLKYCPLLGCVALSTSCIPLSSCPADKPKRCPFMSFKDGSSPCVDQNATCPTDDAIVVRASCPMSQSLCPGGLQCAPGSGAEFFRVSCSIDFSVVQR